MRREKERHALTEEKSQTDTDGKTEKEIDSVCAQA